MNKFTYGAFVTASVCILLPLSGCLKSCEKEINYLDYVTERRANIYLYEDDEISVKIYCSERESPFVADGYVGDMCAVTEVFVALPKTYDEVYVSVADYSGSMNYQSVENIYYASFTAEDYALDCIDVNLSFGDNEKTYSAQSVRYDGVISCDDAVKCVIEYDGDAFAAKTVNGLFDGEIFVRLIYDEGCYYYVGICGKDKKISAYLLDGERGKIIATKTLQG